MTQDAVKAIFIIQVPVTPSHLLYPPSTPYPTLPLSPAPPHPPYHTALPLLHQSLVCHNYLPFCVRGTEGCPTGMQTNKKQKNENKNKTRGMVLFLLFVLHL